MRNGKSLYSKSRNIDAEGKEGENREMKRGQIFCVDPHKTFEE